MRARGIFLVVLLVLAAVALQYGEHTIRTKARSSPGLYQMMMAYDFVTFPFAGKNAFTYRNYYVWSIAVQVQSCEASQRQRIMHYGYLVIPAPEEYPYRPLF